MSTDDSQTRYLLYAVGAFGFWGLAPIYFKWIDVVSPFEIMAHRVIWSALFLWLFMIAFKREIKLAEIVATPRLLGGLILSCILISVNWFLFVWAVVNDQVLSTSLGYFINPVISVFLGMLFLGERLSNKQYFALGLVLLAIANMIWSVGELPWIALSLAFSFGLYGLIRKQLEIDSFNGLFFEVLLVLPLALGYLWYLQQAGELSFLNISLQMDGLLILGGFVTLFPLVLFAASVKGIKLSTVGFIQYLAPSLTFLLAVFYFGEPFSFDKLVSFILIWCALVLISFDLLRQRKINRGG